MLYFICRRCKLTSFVFVLDREWQWDMHQLEVLPLGRFNLVIIYCEHRE
jgi:hypothetical protein